MSGAQHPAGQAHPAMDMKQHAETYKGFMALTKWGTIFIIVLLILMAIFLL
jgi:hypothetical protein